MATTKLAPYATDWRKYRGRFVEEAESTTRTPFQRDRDRIIHCDAFRRLQYKTQVFVNHEGDEYRTRLTHSIEVGQITRSLCRALQLDEDLGEAVALAHDLGHPPFGHAGEDALNEAMAPFGGFRHNEQTLRVLRVLERRYVDFDGLNLTWETLEGVAKHNGPIDGEVPGVFDGLEVDTWCGMEAQVAALADDIAYNHHDLDDGLRSGILSFDQVAEQPSFKAMFDKVSKAHKGAERNRLVKETLSRMISAQVDDLLAQTRANLERLGPKSSHDVRLLKEPVVAFSGKVDAANKELKKFLRANMYHHYRVNRMALKAHRVVKDLCTAFMEHRRCLPTDVQTRLPVDKADLHGKARIVMDYVASMTDRYALLEHSRLFDPTTRP
jgi:dGTPase